MSTMTAAAALATSPQRILNRPDDCDGLLDLAAASEAAFHDWREEMDWRWGLGQRAAAWTARDIALAFRQRADELLEQALAAEQPH